jgi:hypothetical protein
MADHGFRRVIGDSIGQSLVGKSLQLALIARSSGDLGVVELPGASVEPGMSPGRYSSIIPDCAPPIFLQA